MLQAEGALPAKAQRPLGTGAPGNEKTMSVTDGQTKDQAANKPGGPLGYGKEDGLCPKGQGKVVNTSFVGITETD